MIFGIMRLLRVHIGVFAIAVSAVVHVKALRSRETGPNLKFKTPASLILCAGVYKIAVLLLNGG